MLSVAVDGVVSVVQQLTCALVNNIWLNVRHHLCDTTATGLGALWALHVQRRPFCLVLSCLVLSCLVLSCLVLSCLVLSCLVLSSHFVFLPVLGAAGVLGVHFRRVGFGCSVVAQPSWIPESPRGTGTHWPLSGNRVCTSLTVCTHLRAVLSQEQRQAGTTLSPQEEPRFIGCVRYTLSCPSSPSLTRRCSAVHGIVLLVPPALTVVCL